MQISVIHPGVFLVAAIFAAWVAPVSTQQCEYNVTDGQVINAPLSEKNGVAFLSDIYSPTREDCQSSCCNWEKELLDDGSIVGCNLAVFHNHGKPNKANCFIIFCPAEDSCRFSDVREFSSSFVAHTVEPTQSEVLNKPPHPMFILPDAAPKNLHKLFRRSNADHKTPVNEAAGDAKETAKDKEAVDEVEQMMKILDNDIKEAAKQKTEGLATTVVSTQSIEDPQETTSNSSTTIIADNKNNADNNSTQQEAVVATTASSVNVTSDSVDESTPAQSLEILEDVEATTEDTSPEDTTQGTSAGVQSTSKQVVSKLPPSSNPTTLSAASTNPATSILLTKSTYTGNDSLPAVLNTPESTSSSPLNVSLSINTSLGPSGSTVAQTYSVHPSKPPSVKLLPTAPATNTSVQTSGSSLTTSASISDLHSTVTQPSTSADAHAHAHAQSYNATESLPHSLPAEQSISTQSVSSSNPSPNNSSSQTPSQPHLSVTMQPTSLNGTASVSTSFQSTPTLSNESSTASPTTLLLPALNQSHDAPNVSLTTIQSNESTQPSTLYSDEDVTSPTSAVKETLSPTATSPSKSTPSISSNNSISSTLEPLRRNLEENRTSIANETAASVDTDEGEQDTTSNSLIASNGALIAAVCFGVLFLLAVLVVIGKHWYDAYQRRHYSKVDFLINGMYK